IAGIMTIWPLASLYSNRLSTSLGLLAVTSFVPYVVVITYRFEHPPPHNPSTSSRTEISSRQRCMVAHPREVWCARQDLNLHGLLHYHLKVARLPIPPRAQRIDILCAARGEQASRF